jgi:hypothetical protein
MVRILARRSYPLLTYLRFSDRPPSTPADGLS